MAAVESRAIGRQAGLGHSGMRRQGEREPMKMSDEDRMKIANSTYRTSNQYVAGDGQEGVGQSIKEPAPTVLPSKMPRQLVKPMVDTIDPFPMPKIGHPAKGAGGGYHQTERLSRARAQNDLDYVETKRFDAQKSSTGRVANGLHDSRGFIEVTTEQQRRQAECISEDALDAFRKGREKEMEIARQRAALAAAPLLTQKPPDAFMSSSKADFVPLLSAVDRSAADVCHTKPCAKGKRAQMNTKMHAAGNMDYTGNFRDRDEQMKDEGTLKALRENESATARAAAEVGKPKSAAWVGGPPRSTYKDNLREFDVKECEKMMSALCTAPVAHAKHKTLDSEAEAYIAHVEHRKATRNEGDYATQASETLRDRFTEAEPTTHRRAHIFDKKNGSAQMPRRGDAPLRRNGNAQDPKSMSDINPSHFMSTKDLQERLALGGLKP